MRVKQAALARITARGRRRKSCSHFCQLVHHAPSSFVVLFGLPSSPPPRPRFSSQLLSMRVKQAALARRKEYAAAATVKASALITFSRTILVGVSPLHFPPSYRQNQLRLAGGGGRGYPRPSSPSPPLFSLPPLFLFSSPFSRRRAPTRWRRRRRGAPPPPEPRRRPQPKTASWGVR